MYTMNDCKHETKHTYLTKVRRSLFLDVEMAVDDFNVIAIVTLCADCGDRIKVIQIR